ncbi:hypothetical protein BDV93DRAFT_287566 [Ceratobasidium sp. AG-I]|nr:hypothetical protein BDV93DRAFT_287566 [Ceratobasidium sp. AG-I]
MEKYPYALTSLEKVDSYRGARKHTSEIRHTFVCHAEWLYECTNLTNGPDPVVSRRILQRWAEKAPRKRELAARDRRQGWGVWDAQWDKEDPGKQFKREERRLRYQIRLNDKKAAETDSEEENASDDMRPEYDLPNRKYAGLNNQRRSGKDKDVEMRSAGWDDEESSDSGGWRGSKQGKARARGNGQDNKSYKSHRKADKGKGKGKAADYKHSWVKAPKTTTTLRSTTNTRPRSAVEPNRHTGQTQGRVRLSAGEDMHQGQVHHWVEARTMTGRQARTGHNTLAHL